MFSIGQVSKKTGIKVPTIRYYEGIGLVEGQRRSKGNQRRYADSDLLRLSFIKHARELGFSIASVRQLLALSESSLKNCNDINELASNQLLKVRQKIEQLSNLELELSRMVDGCGGGQSQECYVIESLSDHNLCNGNH